jgi:hypothetical protein
MGLWKGAPHGTKPTVVLAALIACLAPGVALASQSDSPDASRALSFHGTSPDGTHAYIQTPEQLVRADTDRMIDVYEIGGGGAKLVSIGPNGGNRDGTCLYRGGSGPDDPPYFESCDARFAGTSGGRVYFRSESLRSTEADNNLFHYYREGDSLTLAEGVVAETEDNSRQILQDFEGCLYQRIAGVSTLISTGPAVSGGGCPPYGDFHFVSQTPDGTTVFFLSTKPLVAADTDAQRDLYRSRNGETTLISTGPADAGGGFAGTRHGSRKSGFETISTTDGNTVVFKTSAKLTEDDKDSVDDIYLRTGTTTTLVSGAGASDIDLVGQSDDLGTIFFESADALDPADTNDESDVYRWKNGTISLLAVTPDGQPFAHGSTFLDASTDGTKVFFYAWENDGFLTGEIYGRSAGTTTRLSPPGVDYQWWSDWVGASDDGSKVYFDSRRPLTDDDDDGGKLDLYRYENGALTLISADPSPVDPEDADDAFASSGPLDSGDPMSDDGSRIYFRSKQSLTPEDTDCGRVDFYEHSDAGNQLVTMGAGTPTIAPGPCAFDTNTPTFGLEPAQPGDSLECRIDQDDFEPCYSPFTPQINNGEHVLSVRGNSSTDPQSGVADRRFTVEADQPPSTTITEGPTYSWDFQHPDQYRRPAFQFLSSEQTGHLECSFDGEPFELCDQSVVEAGSTGMDRPDEPLSYGPHSFEVRAVDGGGNVDPTPDRREFTLSPYSGDLELELSETGVPASLRKLAASGLEPAVRCSKSCRVEARVTLRAKAQRGFRTVKFGSATGDAGLDATSIAVKPSVHAKRILRKAKRASLRIELTAAPKDGHGPRPKLTRVELLKKRR